MTTLITNKRYTLQDKLGEGGMGAVYRAVDRLTGDVVAYKQVITQKAPDVERTEIDVPVTHQDPMTLRLALAREFELLASVKHPNVISVLDYGFDDQQNSYFTMSVLDNPRTLLEASENQPLPVQADLLFQLMQALSYLHRRGIVHCDLKPDNVLVTDDAKVRVVDFGLATIRNRQSTNDVSGGTIAYMAPEVIQGEAASFAADMYAVGVMAYEMFVGEHPFNVQSMSELISAALFQDADMSKLEKTIQLDKPISELDPDQIYQIQRENIGDHLIPFVERLLEKDAYDRIADPEEGIRLLTEVTHLPPPEETVEIRESFLQAAQFIGRDAELQQLTDALSTAIDGSGSAWLIGGESGVGKSRLINELRTRALVEGVLVLRGQETRERTSAYAVWNNVLQYLVLNIEITDLEAGILKPIVPNISKLLAHTIDAPPALEPKQAQERLIGTVISLFRRLDKPAVVILEDLQWTTEGLELLKRMNALVQDIPLLVVGSYRNDERPELPDDLPLMHAIKLERLSETSVTELAVSMIGEQARNPDLIELLQRETEGNTFFLVEVMRTLAEEAGQLRDIALMELPKTVFAGGVRAILQRRIERIPRHMRPMLEIAALAGRQIDLPVLERIKDERGYTINLDTWLTTCANLAVIELQDDAWRFSHDKLRDAALVSVDDMQFPKLHKSIAVAIEATYDVLESQAIALAFHWQQAGNEAKEKEYSIIAGQQSYNNSNYILALQYLERAAEIEEDTTANAMLQYQLGEVYRALNDYDRATKRYELARDVTGDSYYLASLGLALAALDTGRANDAIDFLQGALEHFQANNDKANEVKTLSALSRANGDLGDISNAKEYAQRAVSVATESNQSRSESLALFQLGVMNLQTGEPLAARQNLEDARQIDKRIGNRRGEAFSSMYIGVSHFMAGQLREGLPFVDYASEVAADIGDRRLEATTLLNSGASYDEIGDYYTACDLYERAAKIYNNVGDVRHYAHVMGNLADSYTKLGDYPLATKSAEKAIESGSSLDAPDLQATFLDELAQTAIVQNRIDLAADTLEDCLSIAESASVSRILRRAYGHQAIVHALRDEWEQALVSADKGLAHESDYDPEIILIMKAIALLRLQQLDNAKEAIRAAHDFATEEHAESPERWSPVWMLATVSALQLMVADPQAMMDKLSDTKTAYETAIDTVVTKGILDTAMRYVSFLEPIDGDALLIQVRMQLEEELNYF